MRPSSIIFLIVSVLVIAAGCVLCSIGTNMAAEQGVALFETDVTMIDGDVIRSDTFDAAEINKIKMNLDEVQVVVKPSETEESYIELRNFQVGSYDYSIQNKMLLLDNETSLFSLMRIAEGNFSFQGLRHYLTYKAGANTEKAVYVYLAADASVKAFDIAVRRGSVTVEDLPFTVDYNIALKAGDINLRRISTKSAVNLSTNKGIVTTDDLICRSASIIVGTGAVDMYMRNIPAEFSVSVMDGDIDCGYSASTDYGLHFKADASGTILYNGEETAERPFDHVTSPGAYAQEFYAENGNVSIAIKAQSVSGRFASLSEELAKEAETEDLDVIVVETEASSDPVSEE